MGLGQGNFQAARGPRRVTPLSPGQGWPRPPHLGGELRPFSSPHSTPEDDGTAARTAPARGVGEDSIAQLEKDPSARQETLVRFLGWEDPLEKG